MITELIERTIERLCQTEATECPSCGSDDLYQNERPPTPCILALLGYEAPATYACIDCKNEWEEPRARMG